MEHRCPARLLVGAPVLQGVIPSKLLKTVQITPKNENDRLLQL